MKLSEKYLQKLKAYPKFLNSLTMGDEKECLFMEEEVKLYASLIALEARQTLIVENPYAFPHEKQMELLAGVVNKLQEIAEKEKL